MIETLLEISKNISNRLDCTRFGNCIHFAELFVEKVAYTNRELLEEFYVIEGYVTRMISKQYYHTDQREIIVKKGSMIKCKIIWKGNY